MLLQPFSRDIILFWTIFLTISGMVFFGYTFSHYQLADRKGRQTAIVSILFFFVWTYAVFTTLYDNSPNGLAKRPNILVFASAAAVLWIISLIRFQKNIKK